MKRPVILLDVDGVLANFIEANLRTLREIGVEREHDDVTQWYLEEALKLTSSQRARMKARWSEPGFCLDIPVYPGAVAGVEALRAIGDVYAVTAPMTSGPTWQHERTEWLVRHFDFRRNDVVQTAAKHIVGGDVLVEDKLETLRRWEIEHPAGVSVAWDRRYNAADLDGWRPACRTSDWGTVRSIAAAFADRGGR